MDNAPNKPGRKAMANQHKDVPLPGTTLVTYRGHSNGTGVLAVAWSPDGQYIASAGEIRLYRYGMPPREMLSSPIVAIPMVCWR